MGAVTRLALLAMVGCAHEVALPEPLSNNAVAAVVRADGGCTIVSAFGLTAPRADAIVGRAYSWSVGDAAWHRLPDLPGAPRIAASAVVVRGAVYVLGGYDVAPDRHETSHAEMSRLGLGLAKWESAPSLPLPIDDAVAVAWRDRFIIVISGWSNDAPVSKVQLFDVETQTWSDATPFPGTPVFGHAAALDGDELLVLDGVAKAPDGYQIVAQTWSGTLDPSHPESIIWRDLGAHPGPPRYRAAAGRTRAGDLVFAGGTADPYNFDGISYRHKTPSAPEPSFLVWKRSTRHFELHPFPQASMDHRALASCGDALYLVGGMTAGPHITPAVTRMP